MGRFHRSVAPLAEGALPPAAARLARRIFIARLGCRRRCYLLAARLGLRWSILGLLLRARAALRPLGLTRGRPILGDLLGLWCRCLNGFDDRLGRRGFFHLLATAWAATSLGFLLGNCFSFGRGGLLSDRQISHR